VIAALEAIQRNFPILGYGVDIGLTNGLEKIWPFFPHQPQPVQAIAELPYLPRAIAKNLSFLLEFGLREVSLFALDLHNATVNIYFLYPPHTFSAGQITSMFGAAKLACPEPPLIEHCRLAIPVYCTFSWQSDAIVRLCFGSMYPDHRAIPTEMDPMLGRYVERAPFVSDTGGFIMSTTSTSEACFIKIENDYNGQMIELMNNRP
jgi:hypothetical protein